MKFWTGLMMLGIGFTLGLVLGLLAHLPAESLPAATFDSHHLNRVRRVAQVDNGADYGLSDNTFSDKQGSVGKHIAQVDLVDNSYNAVPIANLNNRGYDVLSKENSPHVTALGRYPVSNDKSVVYLSHDQRKLVLNNTVNNGKASNQLKNEHGRGSLTERVAETVHQKSGSNPQGHVERTPGSGDYDKHRSTPTRYDVTTGVFWSDNVEQSCPRGFSDEETRGWKTMATDDRFLAMHEGCGRMQNRVLTFESMDRACARYRLNVDQMQGEMYSYYLSKVLGIDNVPPSVLRLADTSHDQWRTIGQDVANAKWSEEKPVILSKWIDGLTPSFIPREFRNLSSPLSPKEISEQVQSVGNEFVSGAGTPLCELLQWSDLIVFDYLTANLDRVVNNLFNLQWNAKMMEKPAHNLEKDSQGRLLFIDNESGLFHGYRLLEKYASYHETLLSSLCIFRTQTIDSIKRLVNSDSVNEAIHSMFEQSDPLYKTLPRIPGKNIKMLTSRMEAVLRQVKKCESLNS